MTRAPFHPTDYARQARLARDADRWMADRFPDEPFPRTIGGESYRESYNASEITPAFDGWVPREIAVQRYAGPREQVLADVLVTLATGEVVTEEAFTFYDAEPQIDHVTQGATTRHRDRRAFTNMRRTRVIYRPACEAPCELDCQLVHEHRDYWAHAQYRRGEAVLVRCEHKRHRESASTSVVELEAHGDPRSRTMGRRARRRTTVRWSDATYASDGSTERSASVTAWPQDRSITLPGTWIAGLCTGTPTDAIERTWQPMVSEGNTVDGTPWQSPPALVVAPPRKRTDPVKTLEEVQASTTLLRRIARSEEGQQWVAAILDRIEQAYETGRPQRIHAGITLSYVPDAVESERLTATKAGHGTPGPDSCPIATSSWRGRKTFARGLALSLIEG